jgi:hypothetical protein
MNKQIWASVFVFVLTACSHPSKNLNGVTSSEKNESKRESSAEKAVEKTEEDEHMAPAIQRDVNAVFFKGKEENPGGLDAFSPDRIQELEIELTQSDKPSVKYYTENREFFDRVEDAGGGFRIVANAKRLVPFRWTKAGRRKLFEMDMARVKEMIANPCFSAVEDCGEDASDGEANTALLDEWVKKYSEKEYKLDREKVLRSYLTVLEKYQRRVAHGVPVRAADAKSKGKTETPKILRARQAAFLVGTHIRGVQMLIKD